jgi:hypothetical protein
MFAIFVPNFLSSSNLRLRKCHSFLTPFSPSHQVAPVADCRPGVDAKVQQHREAGLNDDIRKTVLSLAIDHTQRFGAHGIDLAHLE